jgi:hypothetical protein
LRRIETPRKKWSMKEKWFGARITGPVAGTFSGSIPRVRKNVHAWSVVTIRVASYAQSGSRVRARSWKRVK